MRVNDESHIARASQAFRRPLVDHVRGKVSQDRRVYDFLRLSTRDCKAQAFVTGSRICVRATRQDPESDHSQADIEKSQVNFLFGCFQSSIFKSQTLKQAYPRICIDELLLF